MKINEIHRAAALTWCPCTEHTDIIATGSIAGSLEDFSSGSKIELFAKDLNSSEAKLLGSTNANDRFNRLSWGNPLPETYSYGIIAGAMVDGTVGIWDASKIIDEEKTKDSLLTTLDKHTGSVRGLSFNKLQPNLMATAGEDSMMYIWNLQKPEAPVGYTIPGKNPHTNHVISNVAWNQKFDYILATSSHQGSTVVWDLKNKKPLSTLKNPNTKDIRRYSSLAWNPEAPTELLIACEDDSSPVIEYWDLRKAHQPLREFTGGHTKGILSVSWCPDDSNLLLSGGKDNRVIIWNPSNGEILGELPSSSAWINDVQWSSRPSILSTASYDGIISILSLQDSSGEPNENVSSGNISGFEQALGTQNTQKVVKKNVFKTAPKWLQRPVGVSFGFGGKLYSFNSKSRSVKVDSFVSDAEFTKRSLEFENIIKEKSYQKYIDRKLESCKPKEQLMWNVMKSLFDDNFSESLLKCLGFDKEEIKKKVEEKIQNPEEVTNEDEKTEAKLTKETADELLTSSLMVNDFESAVEVSLLAGNMSDALVLAACKGGELWEKTRTKYLSTKKSIMGTLSLILNHKLEDLVKDSDLEKWKETLSLISTFGKEKFQSASELLAKRLEEEKFDVQSATICYMCSRNPEKTISIWLNTLGTKKDTEALVEFMEKVLIYQQTLSSSTVIKLSPELVEKYSEYASLLASQGLMSSSLRYLNMIHALSNDEKLDLLRFRVYHSLSKPFGDVPKNPFKKLQIQETKKETHQKQQLGGSQQNMPQNWNGQVVQQPQQFNQQQQQQQQQPQQYNTPYPSPFQHQNIPRGGPVQNQTQTSQQVNTPPKEFGTGTHWNQPKTDLSAPMVPFSQVGTNPMMNKQMPPPTSEKVFNPQMPQSSLDLMKQKEEIVQPKVIQNTKQTILQFDVNSVQGDAQMIIDALNKALHKCFSGNVSDKNLTKKRMVESGLNSLFEDYKSNKIGNELTADLLQYAKYLNEQNYSGTEEMIKSLSSTHWKETKSFSKGLKFLNQILKDTK
eukprot:gene496-8010_t